MTMTTEIIEQAPLADSSLANVSIDALARAGVLAPARAVHIATLVKVAVMETQPWQWTNFGGTPYLMGKGAADALKAIAGKASIPHFKNPDDRIGDDYFVEVVIM